jgi:hypothetical protein
MRGIEPRRRAGEGECCFELVALAEYRRFLSSRLLASEVSVQPGMKGGTTTPCVKPADFISSARPTASSVRPTTTQSGPSKNTMLIAIDMGKDDDNNPQQ